MLKELIMERKLPKLLIMKNGNPVLAKDWAERRKELVDILAENVYGKMPDYAGGTTWYEHSEKTNAAAMTEAYTRKVDITFPTPYKDQFTFPVSVSVPASATAENPKAAFVFISFGRPQYYPIEELMEKNVIVAEFVLNDVALDAEDHYKNGMAAHYFPDGKREPDGFGKIGMWAFAASRVLDYLLSLDYVDKRRVGVIGHSRLGKTALWAGANDERFTHVISNDSGCAGAALTRKKVGEDFPRIYRVFPYWFCENMKKLSVSVDTCENSSFDQHFLIAASAPRKVCVASAALDEWADPVSEYLSCVAASPAWKLNGVDGFIHPDRLPEGQDRFADGNLVYHIRPGVHFLSRHDWVRYCDFLNM